MLREKIEEYIEAATQISNPRAAFWALTPVWLLLILIFFFFVFLFSSWDYRINWINDKLNPNKVIVEHNLDIKEKITIKWTCDNFCDTLIIYDKNKVQKTTFKNSGENLFFVYINDSLIFHKSQYKGVFWKGYKYIFRITRKNNIYSTEMFIKD